MSDFDTSAHGGRPPSFWRMLVFRVLPICLLLVLAGLSSLYFTVEGTAENKMIQADFKQRAGVPLIKKFGLFNSGLVPLNHYERDAGLFDGLRADSLRIDLYFGNRSAPMGSYVTGSADNITLDLGKLDGLIRLLAAHGVKPYWSWSYIPIPLQKDHDWRSGPVDLDAWRSMFRSFAEHYKELGLRIAYNEIYNEPDCGDTFFLGSMEDYTDMYIAAAQGLLEGNPDSVIGGPSSAFVDELSSVSAHYFLEKVQKAGVPLDFFSFHSYGCDRKQYLVRTSAARALLAEVPALDTTELQLNEYNSLIQPFKLDGPAEHALGGSTMLTSFELLLDETDVTLAHWAQFMDTGLEPLGAVGPDGRLKAPYWALWMYSQMPEQRVLLIGLSDPKEEGLHGMASADEKSACILLWNDDAQNGCQGTLELKDLPFEAGTMKAYRMDDAVDPYWQPDTDTSVRPSQIVVFSAEEPAPSSLEIDLPPAGFMLIQFNGPDQEKDPVRSVGTIVRKRYYFPERGKANYVFFDETDQTAYLGMNGETSARSVVAVEYDGLPERVALKSKLSGAYRTVDQYTNYSVRVDYEVGGKYVKAVEYAFMPPNPRRNVPVPWGTGNPADIVEVAPTLLTGTTWLSLGANAPEGWGGRALITWDMHSVGEQVRVEATLEPLGK